MPSSSSPRSPVVADITYVVSSDALLLDEARKALVRAALGDGMEAFNVSVLDALEDGIEIILDACRPLPVKAKRRIVVCKRAHKLPAASTPELLAYLAKPNPTTALIFLAERLDARTKLSTALTREKKVLRKEPPRPQAMAAWAEARAREADWKMSARAAHALIERVGPEPLAVAQALDKLQAMAGEGRELTESLIWEGIGFSQAAQIFALSNALYALDFAPLVALMNRLLNEGQSPLGMLGLMAREVRLLLGAAAFEGPRQALATHLGIRDFVADRLLARVRNKSVKMLSDDLCALGEAEFDLKKSGVPAHLILSRLALRFVRER